MSYGKEMRKKRKQEIYARITFFLIGGITGLVLMFVVMQFIRSGSNEKQAQVENPHKEAGNQLSEEELQEKIEKRAQEIVAEKLEKGEYIKANQSTTDTNEANKGDEEGSKTTKELADNEEGGKRKEYGIVSKTEKVSDDYFKDAVFIGASRTDGFRLNSGLTQGTFLCYKGIDVLEIYSKNVIKTQSGTVSIIEALKQKKYKKIYLMLGLNELGWPYPEEFYKKYEKVVKDIKKYQPDAVIYLESIICVTKSKSNSDKVFNMKNVNRFNEQIQKAANALKVYYLDLNEVLAGSDGYLPEDASFDGVHLKQVYSKKWLEYLKNHAIKVK